MVAAPGNTEVVLSWGAPADDGGSAITAYVVTPVAGDNPQSPIAVGDHTSATVTGLTDGIASTFTVAAQNANGTGPPSAHSTPLTVESGTMNGADTRSSSA